jgi:hypothetical protein
MADRYVRASSHVWLLYCRALWLQRSNEAMSLGGSTFPLGRVALLTLQLLSRSQRCCGHGIAEVRFGPSVPCGWGAAPQTIICLFVDMWLFSYSA